MRSERLFRELRSEWFRIQLKKYYNQANYDQEVTVNEELWARFDADTNALLAGELRNVAPLTEYDVSGRL